MAQEMSSAPERERVDSEFRLVLDQGGHASRALVFDCSGTIQAHAEYAVSVQQIDAMRVEQDPEEIVASLESCLAQARSHLGPSWSRVTRAGLATQRSSIVCWDRTDGTPLSPVLSWQDRRAHAWLAQFQARAADIHARTGLFLSPHYGVSKLRWCLDHLPAVARAAAEGRLCFGPLASFLVFRLLAERPFAVDVANAARTLLLDVHRLAWDDELLALFGIPRACLPEVVASTHAFGHLRAHGLPLALVTGDQSAALFAQGAALGNHAYVNVGTGAFVQLPLGDRLRLHPRLLAGIVFRSAHEREYVLEGTVNGAASALQWLAQTTGEGQLETRLPDWLASTAAPPLFLNGVGGLGAPYWVPDFASRFVGQGTLAEQAVAVVESVVFLLEENLRLMAPAHGIATLEISGGLSRLDGLCQRLADIARCTVVRPEMTEATARGVAWLLCHRPAWTAPRARRFTPTPNSQLADRYERWQEALLRSLPGK